MNTRKMLTSLLAVAALGFGAGYARRATAQKPPAAAPAGGAGGAAGGAAAPTNCKAYGGGKCCDPAVMAHLTKEAVFKACGESEATFLGEAGKKDVCKYTFKVEGEKPDSTYVEVYTAVQKDPPPVPQEPFFSYKKVGKVAVTEKAKSPKMQGAIDAATGLYLATKTYIVSVQASKKVCTKAEAAKLAPSMK